MFCKWCGADLPNFATKCNRCGKEVPAMSDCGGFYDLVPNAQRPPVAEPIYQQVNPASLEPACPEKEKKTKKRSRGGFPLAVTCIGFVMVIALLLALGAMLYKCFVDMEELSGHMEAVSSRVNQLEKQMDSDEEDETEDADEAPVSREVLLEEQDVLVEIQVTHTQTGSQVTTKADLGEYADVATAQVSFDEQTQSLSAVQVDLSQAEACINIEIENVQATSLRKGSVSVEIDLKESLFGEGDGEEEYQWTYRIADSTKWVAVDEDVFAVSEDGAAVTYSADALAELLEDAELAELRLVCTRENAEGGSLTVILSGIPVHQ